MPREWKKEVDEAIKGLLGDFPQGFNAGATAGVPGWAGDMAYLVDMGKRGLLGEPGINPRDFPGTTDYIASKAGYPVPESLSGQLGAAVGGLLSPGPGDLARFAPVLAAIPFWHGSPHKFDAVDLSKMGTGEGAQAYGWGFYGADAADVAKNYAPRDPETETKLMRLYDQAVQRGDYESAQVFEDAMLHKTPDEIAADYPQKEFAKAIDQWRKLHSKEGTYLYRGEYVWPDPAKEAATPLTPEDLLQWDRPLSEQSETVKAALRRMPSAPDESVWPQWTGQQLYESEVRAGTDFDGLFKGDARKEHSLSLHAAGIPGMRYLDQGSRDAGTGTYNTVMFDQEGINLLERNGEALEAFKAKRAGKAKPYKEAMSGSR